MTDVTPTTWSEFQTASWLRARREGIPLSGTFELTPLCNFRCRMCYVRVDALPEGTRLRTAEGICLEELERLFGAERRERLLREAVRWTESGVLAAASGHLRIPPARMLVSDAVIESFFETEQDGAECATK